MTTSPLTAHQLADIEARVGAAFEGPWKNDQTQEDDTPVVYAPRTTEKGTAYAHVLFEADWGTDADAEFIAHAREDVAVLLAEVRRLQDELPAVVGVSESLYRRLSQEQLAGSALYAALTMPTTPQQRQAALDQFTTVAQQVFGSPAAPAA